MKKGFSLIEVLVAILIVFILAALSLRVIHSVSQRAKVVSAKAEISQLALALEKIKDDTGLYPIGAEHLFYTPQQLEEYQADTTIDEYYKYPPYFVKHFKGPYLFPIPEDMDLFLDPWGNPYHYSLQEVTLFGPEQFGGKIIWAVDTTRTFSGEGATKGILRVERNGILQAFWIELNGKLIFSLWDWPYFTKAKPVDLLVGENTLHIYGVGILWRKFWVRVCSWQTWNKNVYEIISYGKDGVEGGKGFNKDIIWKSDTYPHFQ